MTGLKPKTYGAVSDRFTNWATTTDATLFCFCFRFTTHVAFFPHLLHHRRHQCPRIPSTSTSATPTTASPTTTTSRPKFASTIWASLTRLIWTGVISSAPFTKASISIATSAGKIIAVSWRPICSMKKIRYGCFIVCLPTYLPTYLPRLIKKYRYLLVIHFILIVKNVIALVLI